MGEVESKWYLDVGYEEAKQIIHNKLRSMTTSFIGAGYYLRMIRDTEGFRKDGYDSIYEFAEAQYGIKRPTTLRWMQMNERFSDGGYSPIIASEYREFGKSQLQEMLYLTDEQMEEVSPDMTVKDIREVRKPEAEEPEQIEGQMDVNDYPELPPEEQVSILGYPRREYPAGSLIATPGCGKQDCFACHRDGCEIRGEECWCVETLCGNPFPCTTLNVVDNIRQEIGTRCQFVNEDLALHRAGDGQPVPCCKKCPNPCSYECKRAADARTEQSENVVCNVAQDFSEEIISENDTDQEDFVIKPTESVVESTESAIETTGVVIEEEPASDQWSPIFIRDHLCEEEKNLETYFKAEGLPQAVMLKQEALVRGLRLILDEAERDKEECEEVDPDESAVMQPELPALKNMEQREQFVLGYQTWPIWCRNELTEETYYRYDLPDGSAIVVREFPYYGYWAYKKGGTMNIGKTLFLLKEGIKAFKDGETNMTALKEHLKDVQKGGKNS